LKLLKRDEFEDELHELTLEDARLGRMTQPIPVEQCCLDGTKLHPRSCGMSSCLCVGLQRWLLVLFRFGVVQGVKANGAPKVRAVDNMSWAHCAGRRSKKRVKAHSVNGFCAVPERVKHDHLDELAASMKLFLLWMGTLPGLFKADVSAAFRRIPLRPDHAWAAGVVYRQGNSVWVSWHKACMFGATSSVYNWERIGALLTSIIIRVLNICLFRYVDDLFAAERLESMEHAMQCVARLVRLLLGPDSMDEKKLQFGAKLDILGINCMLAEAGLYLMPAEKKAEKCIETIRAALGSGVMHAGCAQKLAGRLSWAQTFMFHKVGRAMLRPIFDQKWSKSGQVSKMLRTALMWWLNVLALTICECRPWTVTDEPPVHVFVDARGVPPRCAAVAVIDGKVHHSDGEPSERIMKSFQKRADSQICGLEMLAIALGLSVFANELKGRKVIMFSDNKGAEGATRKGTAKAWDHCQIIHEIWTMALQSGIHLWLERVPTDDNVSDLPSRQEYSLLQEMGSVWREPVIASMFLADRQDEGMQSCHAF